MREKKRAGERVLRVDPRPRFDLSPYLYMQFMEPLGTTDSSVEAGWDFGGHRWRDDLVEVTRDLAPSMIRWGGCFSSYYRWREGVGPRNRRRPVRNLLWGGVETNQVGTHEFVDFNRRVGAEPLIGVNFESDGRERWAHPPGGKTRAAGPREAAAWVDYCNNPSNRLRRKHGVKKPYGVRFWQIGNETSYDPSGFDCETAARKTLTFARTMRRADPDVALIGWGDSGWARRMLEIAGEELQYLAFHNMFNPCRSDPDCPLRGVEYRRDPARTWDHLMKACEGPESKIRRMREEIAGYDVPLAITECHFALPGRNRCEVLSTWAAGVADARILNVHSRNGDVLKIATLADFCGTRWMVNAVMIPTPGGRSFMTPVARVMSLFRRHVGRKAVDTLRVPDGLDVTASRTGRRLFLHVVNTHRTRSVAARLQVAGRAVARGRIFEIAEDPEFEVMQSNADALAPVERRLPRDGVVAFAPASVSAVELRIDEDARSDSGGGTGRRR